MNGNGCSPHWEQDLILYLDGELSREDGLRIEKHLAECPDCATFFNETNREERLLAGHLQHEMEAYRPDAAFTQSVMNAIPARPSGWRVWLGTRTPGYVPSAGSMAVAATLLICFVAIYATIAIQYPAREQMVQIVRNGIEETRPLFSLVYVDNKNGEFFELPDGSTMYATQGTYFSIHSFPEDDPGRVDVANDRMVSLQVGELFLHVNKQPEAFTVESSNALTRVFGTHFYVGSDGTANTTIGVRRGLVRVDKQARNEMAAVELSSEEMTSVTTLSDERVRLMKVSTIDETLLQRLAIFYQAIGDSSLRDVVPPMLSRSGVETLPMLIPAEPLEDN